MTEPLKMFFKDLERELATLATRIALAKDPHKEDIEHFLKDLESWTLKAGDMGSPWTDSLRNYIWEIKTNIKEGKPLEPVIEKIMRLIIQASENLSQLLSEIEDPRDTAGSSH